MITKDIIKERGLDPQSIAKSVSTNSKSREFYWNVVVRIKQIKSDRHIEFKEYGRNYVFELTLDNDSSMGEEKQRMGQGIRGKENYAAHKILIY
jgi:extradiol dioxygenase family protein